MIKRKFGHTRILDFGIFQVRYNKIKGKNYKGYD